MKPRSFSTLLLTAVLLLAVVFLTACELPSDRSEPIQLDAPPQLEPNQLDTSTQPTVDPNLLPTIDPNLQPTPDPNLQPTVDPNATQQPGEQPTAEQPSTTQTQTYVVQGGDTLGRIAQQFDVAIEDIARANNLVNIDALDIGQELIIPGDDYVPPEPTATPEGQQAAPAGEQEHIVQAGQTLYSIGLRYGFTVAELQAYNNLPNPNVLDVGQVLKIPPKE